MTVISGLAVNSLGPGRSPASIARRTATSRRGLADAALLPDVKVFHSGTRMDGAQVVTDGGRVLSVTALGETIRDAQKRAYEALGKIHFEGMHYRRDIGHWAVQSRA